MLKKCFVAAAILLASPAFASAQDIFWSLSPTEFVTDSYFDPGETGSAYIFSDGLFGFDAIDLKFTTSDPSVFRFTGGEAFNPTSNNPFVAGTRFDSSMISIDAGGSSGGLFSVNILQNGVDPSITPFVDPGFVAGAGPNGALLLARVDFEVIGNGTADLEFALGPQGVIQLPFIPLNPSLGSATLNSYVVLTPYCPFVEPDTPCLPVETDYRLGDVDLSGIQVGNGFIDVSYSVDAFDIAPFIAVLASGGYQREADCNEDGLVNFFDIAPFIEILSSDQGYFF